MLQNELYPSPNMPNIFISCWNPRLKFLFVQNIFYLDSLVIIYSSSCAIIVQVLTMVPTTSDVLCYIRRSYTHVCCVYDMTLKMAVIWAVRNNNSFLMGFSIRFFPIDYFFAPILNLFWPLKNLTGWGTTQWQWKIIRGIKGYISEPRLPQEGGLRLWQKSSQITKKTLIAPKQFVILTIKGAVYTSNMRIYRILMPAKLLLQPHLGNYAVGILCMCILQKNQNVVVVLHLKRHCAVIVVPFCLATLRFCVKPMQSNKPKSQNNIRICQDLSPVNKYSTLTIWWSTFYFHWLQFGLVLQLHALWKSLNLAAYNEWAASHFMGYVSVCLGLSCPMV